MAHVQQGKILVKDETLSLSIMFLVLAAGPRYSTGPLSNSDVSSCLAKCAGCMLIKYSIFLWIEVLRNQMQDNC